MKRILLLEDELTLLRLYTKILKNAGYFVIGAATFQTAMRMFELHHFDLLISDIHVGIVKAEVLLSELAVIQHRHKMPVLVISAQMETYQQRLNDLNLVSLPKPFSSQELLQAADALIQPKKRPHESGLIHLSYASTAAHPMSEQELVDMLQVAREKNERLGITGMLLYSNGKFLQVLEGEAGNVSAVFESITRDERHQNVYQLFEMPLAERQFPQWTMAFRNLSGLTAEQLPGFSAFLDPAFDVADFALHASEAYNLLMSFRQTVNS